MTIYEGVDCLKDKDTDAYAALGQISQSGTHAWAHQQTYAWYVLYWCSALVVAGAVRHWWYKYTDWSYRNGDGCSHRSVRKLVSSGRIVGYRRFPVLLSRVTGLPASFGTVVLLIASLAFVLASVFGPGFQYRGCGGFGSPPLAVRSGMAAMAVLPFLMILSGKTNLISAFTGVSYEKLNVLHQLLGWLTFILSMIHTMPFFLQNWWEGGSANVRYNWQTDDMYRSGVPPLVLLFVLCILSTRFSRRLCYELWLHSHWMLGFAFIGLLTYHAWDSLNSQAYVWATLAFCASQWAYRALVKTTMRPNDAAFKSRLACLTRLPSGNTFEIKVANSGIHWRPGQHVFIRFVMNNWHTLDNHPFSILTVPGNGPLKLLVKPQRGLTKKLYDLIDQDTLNLKCYIDGAYGGMMRDPLAFDKLVLLASGSGVSVTLPFLQYVSQNINLLSNRVRKIEFVWVVKSSADVEWLQTEILDQLDDEFLQHYCEINFFVTNSADGTTPNIISEKSEFKEEYKGDINIQLDSKPDIGKYLKTVPLLNRTAVICSGTSSFQESVGNACAELQKKVIRGEVEEVYLHTENFGW